MYDRIKITNECKEEGKLIRRRMQNQFHRGGKKGKLLPERASYVEGHDENGERRRKRTETRRQFRSVRGRIQTRAKENRKRRIVGTKPVLGQIRKKRTKGKDSGVEYWTKGWESGKFTNAKRVGNSNGEELPGRRRFRHTKEHETARNEARVCGIPTAGVRKADSKKERYEKRRYVLPGNEDSVRGTRRRGRIAEEVYRREKEGNERREEDAKKTERSKTVGI